MMKFGLFYTLSTIIVNPVIQIFQALAQPTYFLIPEFTVGFRTGTYFQSCNLCIVHGNSCVAPVKTESHIGFTDAVFLMYQELVKF